MTRLVIPAHLSVSELERRYRAAHDPVARSHWQIIWLLACGEGTAMVARRTGYAIDWIRVLAKRYREGGPEALGDRRHGNPGGADRALLTSTLREELRIALDGLAPDGGLWTGPKVARWMSERLGRPVGPVRSGPGLGSPAPPRLHAPAAASPLHPRRSRRPGGGQKGGLQADIDAVAARYPDARIDVRAEDEHRLGLLPVTRRVGAPCGQRPVAPVQRRYQWLYVWGVVRPSTGQTWWALLPTVSLAACAVALAEFARDEGVTAQHRVVLVVDRAGWHTSPRLVRPEGLDLVFLPSPSPELPPAERLWPLIDEPVANRAFRDLDELEAMLVTRCQTLRADPPTVRALTDYGWWPHEHQPVAAIPA